MHLHRLCKRMERLWRKLMNARGERCLRGRIRGEKQLVELIELRFGVLCSSGRGEDRLKLLRRAPCRAELRVRIENLREFRRQSNRGICRISASGTSILRHAI